jgi:hypothetical protein
MWMADDAEATDNTTTNHHRERQKRTAVGNQSGGRQLEGRGVDNDNDDEEGSSTLDEESSSDSNDNVRLLYDPPAAAVVIANRRPLALEDQLEILRHNFGPTNRPAPPLATTTMTMTVSDGTDVVGCCRCWGGVEDDNNATMAATTVTPWRTKERQRHQLPATQEGRDASVAGGQRPATQSLTIAGRRATTKRAADKRKQQPTIGC